MLTAAPMILHPQVTLFFCVLAPAKLPTVRTGREGDLCSSASSLCYIPNFIFSDNNIQKQQQSSLTYVCRTHTKILWLRHRVLFSSFCLLKTTYRKAYCFPGTKYATVIRIFSSIVFIPNQLILLVT